MPSAVLQLMQPRINTAFFEKLPLEALASYFSRITAEEER